MAGITLAQANAKLTTWLAAEDKLATAQTTTHNGRTLTRADLSEIRESIDYWNRMVNRLTRGGPSVSRVVLHG